MTLDITTIALVCLALLGAGYAVVLSVLIVPRLRPAAREVLTILHTEAVIVVTAVAAFWIGGWALILCLIAMSLRISYEATFAALTRVGARLRVIAPASLALAALIWLGAVQPLPSLILPGLIALVLCWLLIRLKWPSPVSAPGLALLLLGFPGIPLMIFISAALNGLEAWLLAAFFLVETFDSYALLGGKLFGRTKAFPAISPRKTVEGLAAGTGILMLTAAVVGKLLFDAPVLAAAGFALFVGILAIAGDLAASWLKRLSGLKDFRPVMHVQGGLLDITDAWIAAGAGVAVLAVLAGLV